MTQASRYSAVAIILHWCIAAGIIAMLVSGLVIYQKWLSDAALFQWFQWHKSLGVLLLLLIITRIVWRLFHPPPPKQPSLLSGPQYHASTFGHFVLYLLLITMPLSGWLAVSSSDLQVPTLVFNLFKWPHLPLADAFVEISRTIAGNLHFYGAIVLTLLAFGHVVMVLKHYRHGVNLLQRMPFNRMSISIIAIAAVAVLLLSMNGIGITSSTPESTQANPSGEIKFSGIHAQKPFNGIFKQWSLNTNFNPKATSFDTFELTIDASSISTGNTFYDETLAEEDWFNPDNYPQITFVASSISRLNATQIKLSGTFTVKGVHTPLEFIASMTDGNRLETTFSLSRLQLGLGKNADPDAEWVDENIQLTAWSTLN